jgi:xylulokinase
VPSPLPGSWFVMAENGVGGRALDLWLRVLDQPFDAAERDAASVAPGADGVLFLPWLSGSISPASDGRMRAGFVNMGLDTTRAAMTRAVYEGVALNAAWLLPHVATLAGQAWTTIRFGGGGAQSALWGQVLADALGVTVERLADPSTTNARGAALLAHAQLGHIAIDDIPALIDVAAVHEPDPQAHATYARLLEHFVDFHTTAAPFYARLRNRRR